MPVCLGHGDDKNLTWFHHRIYDFEVARLGTLVGGRLRKERCALPGLNFGRMFFNYKYDRVSKDGGITLGGN